MPKRRIAILTGGTSSERTIALASAKNAETFLKRYVDVTRYDIPQQLPLFLSQYRSYVLVVPLFHGIGGEDGTVQGFLKTLNIPFLFSDITAHAIAINKAYTKILVRDLGIRTPRARVMHKSDKTHARFERPCVIKPLDGGSSLGVMIARNARTFKQSLNTLRDEMDTVLVEDRIVGKEFTVGVVEKDGATCALPVIEIRPKTSFFDHRSKYQADLVNELCPAPIPMSLTRKLQKIAMDVHLHLGARHLTRTDIIVDQRGMPWFLEINTIPGLTKTSLIPKAVLAAGWDLGDLFNEWIERTITSSQQQTRLAQKRSY